ncbi:hypothetical protein MASR2M48_21820 [Spirochaetota bacterium]
MAAARSNMLLASFYGGIAFTRAYVGYVHAIAHNLGGLYGVPHGLGNAVILPYVLDFFGDAVYAPLARLAERAGVSESGQDEATKAKAFIAAIRELNKRMAIPDKIETIKEADIAFFFFFFPPPPPPSKKKKKASLEGGPIPLILSLNS